MNSDGNNNDTPGDSPEDEARTGQKRAAQGETKSERFERLAEGRELATLRDLKLIANLADRRHYEYDSKRAAKLLVDIRRELENAEAAFRKALRGHGGLKLPHSRK